MVKIEFKKIKLLAAALTIILIFSNMVSAQYYYVHGYGSLSDENGFNVNAVYKINLSSKTIEDSLVFNVNGEFTDKKPIAIPSHNNILLLSTLSNGMISKNSEYSNTPNSYYFLYNPISFNIISQDSMSNTLILKAENTSNERILLNWVGFEPNVVGDFLSSYSLSRIDNRLVEIERNDYQNEPVEDIFIGRYKNPHKFGENNESIFYYDMLNEDYINIFSVNHSDNIILEKQEGNCSDECLVYGYSPQNNYIYVFSLRFLLTSTYPNIESPNSVQNNIHVIDASTFEHINIIDLNLGDIYLAHELGAADYFDGYLIYYFFKGDGYGQFDPAYLLIFDTRTNEASWLRVGWR